MAAAPFAATLAAAVAPDSAQATTITPGQFVLTARDSNSYGTFAALNASLATAMGTPTGVSYIVGNDVNRTATHLTSAPDTAQNFVDGFAWDSGDQSVDYWAPQGVTTSADAYGDGTYPSSGTDRAVLVAWRFETQPDPNGPVLSPDKGVRISVVNYNNASAPRYRHVLLVEPITTSTGAVSYQPITIHAGGIMWYGTLLYVVDTYKGLRVFDLENILVADSSDASQCGAVTVGSTTSYYSYGYAYVLPQTHAYDNTGGFLRYTTLGLDRSSTPDSLVVGEYSLSGTVDYSESGFIGTGPVTTTPKVVRWQLDYTTRLLDGPDSGGNVPAHEATTVAQEKIQGVVAHNSTYYLSTSDGPSNEGALRTCTDASAGATFLSYQETGPEDLSYHSASATWNYTGNAIWTLTEYAGGRYVYAVRDTHSPTG